MVNSTLCYIEQDGRWLMLHRVKKENDANHGKWIGIGGKFEEDESPDECLLREVKEETGLTLTRWRYRGIVTFVCPPWPSELMHLFTADGFTGQLTECDEGVLEWVPRAEVFERPLWEGDRVFLKLLQRETDFFSLKLVYREEKLCSAVLNGAALALEAQNTD